MKEYFPLISVVCGIWIGSLWSTNNDLLGWVVAITWWLFDSYYMEKE